MNQPDGVARQCSLPNDEFAPAWTSIKLASGIRERLLSQSLLSFTMRQSLPFESAPLHGLILLTGAPGTGKTTLARGLANQVAKQLSGTKCTYVEIDAHALMSSAHGRSQQAVAKLFEHTIPEIAMNGAAIVLFDEVETLAVSRHHLSLEANPIDVHRAAVSRVCVKTWSAPMPRDFSRTTSSHSFWKPSRTWAALRVNARHADMRSLAFRPSAIDGTSQ